MRHSARPRTLFALLLAAAAFLAAVSITAPPGPGLDPDATSYMGAARSLVREGALRVPAADWASADTLVPLAHFPPGFSAAIAVPLSLGMSAVQAGRLVVALSAAATAALLGWLAAAAVEAAAGLGAGLAAGALAVLLAALSPSGLYTHLSVLSEPLYLACLATVLAALCARPGGRPLLAGLAAAAATMVRYVGLSAAGAAALWALAGPGPWRRRLRDAALAGGPAVIAFALWALRARRLSDGDGGVRKFGVYGGLGATLAQGGATARAWLAPLADAESHPWLGAVAGLAAVAAVTLLVAGARAAARTRALPDDAREPARVPAREPAPDRSRAGRALGGAALLAASHLGFVALSRLVADPGIPFDERILAPVEVLAGFAVAVAAALVWRTARGGARHAVRGAIAVGLALWIAGATSADAAALEWIRAEGSDFANASWRDSPTVAWARGPGRGRTLYTNWPAPLYFHADRAARTTPESLDARTLAEFDSTLARSGGAVVVFAAPSRDVADPDSVVRALGLREVARFADGAVWERAPREARPPR